MNPSSVSRLFALLFLAGALTILPARAQDSSPCPRALEMAQTEFDAGLFERSSQRISVCLERGEFSKEEARQAYLLLGMIYYANLQIEQARDSLRNLLKNDPSVELVPEENFKPGFVDLFSEVRSELQPAPIPAPIPAPRSAAHRSGFWVSAGIGPAGNELTCRACDLLPEGDPWRGGNGAGLAIAMGGSLNDRLLIGGEFNHWGRSVDDNPRSAAISSLSAIIRFYPTATTDFFLKGGLGLGGLALEGESVRIDTGGISVQLGLGYDIRLGQGKRFALSPFANLLAVIAEGGQTRVAGAIVTGPQNPGFAQIGLAATWF
ncbi:MAG: tetratricopeptide repeat protein [Rhodothermales bacterium]|nr:tetratricopeptide repeat protein [Rhodothermales bacterium]